MYLCYCSLYSNAISSLCTENPVGSVVPRQAGGYVIAEGTRFAFVDWVKCSITAVAHVNDKEKPNTRFNDGKVDPAGRFFAGIAEITFYSAYANYKKM